MTRDDAGDSAENAADRALVDALRQGDELAFSALVERHHGPLLRFARVFLKSQASAEEIVQETWLAVINGLDRFEGRSSLRTWIFRILANRAKTRAQRDGRTLTFSSLGDGDAGDELPFEVDRFQSSGHWSSPPLAWAESSPEGVLLRAEVRRQVEQAVATLPEMQAAVVTLRDIDGWTSIEVCNALGVSETNQRVLLHRGRCKLRGVLEAALGRAPRAGSKGGRSRSR